MKRLYLFLILMCSFAAHAQTITPSPITWVAPGNYTASGAFPGGLYCNAVFAGARPINIFYGPSTTFRCISASGTTDHGLVTITSTCPDQTVPDYESGYCKPISTSPALEALLGMSIADAQTLLWLIVGVWAIGWGVRQTIRASNSDPKPDEGN
jgi:hypothetical protein